MSQVCSPANHVTQTPSICFDIEKAKEKKELKQTKLEK